MSGAYLNHRNCSKRAPTHRKPKVPYPQKKKHHNLIVTVIRIIFINIIIMRIKRVIRLKIITIINIIRRIIQIKIPLTK